MMLVLVVVGLRLGDEAWWTVLAAAAMLGHGLVSPHQALDAIGAGKNALLLARGVLTSAHAHTGAVLAALVGADVGPLAVFFVAH
jgi:Na+/H+ antiporter NhaD/arsenite permease-like protein